MMLTDLITELEQQSQQSSSSLSSASSSHTILDLQQQQLISKTVIKLLEDNSTGKQEKKWEKHQNAKKSHCSNQL